MSFRGRGGRGGGFRGGGRGRGRGGRGGGRFGGYQDQGPPEHVVELGQYLHPCEGDLVCKGTNDKVPYFNAPLYLENKSQIGKVDEIFGPINEYLFSVKLFPNMGAESFNKEQKFFIDPMKLLPLMRFLPRPKTPGRGGGVQRGGRGGRGGFGGRGGRGGRGGFTPRGRGGGGFRGRGRGGGGGRGFRGGGRGGRGFNR